MSGALNLNKNKRFVLIVIDKTLHLAIKILRAVTDMIEPLTLKIIDEIQWDIPRINFNTQRGVGSKKEVLPEPRH